MNQILLPPSPPKPRQTENRKPKPAKLWIPSPPPVLRFAPTAWAKLLFFRDRGDSEIGGFGVAQAHDLLRIEEFLSVRQEATMASIAFDDTAVADFFEAQVDAGRKPEQFARVMLSSPLCKVEERCSPPVQCETAISLHNFRGIPARQGYRDEIARGQRMSRRLADKLPEPWLSSPGRFRYSDWWW